MENKWFLDIITPEFMGGKINIDQTLQLLNKFNVSYDYVHVKKLFKTNDKLKSGVITMEDFRAIYRAFMHRPEFHELFCSYSPNKKFLTADKLAEFLRREQFEIGSEGRAGALINTYEPIVEVPKPTKPPAKRRRKLVRAGKWIMSVIHKGSLES